MREREGEREREIDRLEYSNRNKEKLDLIEDDFILNTLGQQ